MRPATKADWIIPAALIALCAIPVAAAAMRLAWLAGGPALLPDNVRYDAAPMPIALHILTVGPYSVLGAFQFSRGFRRHFPRWHRTAGQLLVPLGVTVATTGLWMTWFAPDPDPGGLLLRAFRLLFGSAMLLSIGFGVHAVRKRDFASHGAWMTRAYAIAVGAGTQAFVLLPLSIAGALDDLNSALGHGVAWAINLGIAEWIIRRRSAHRYSRQPSERTTPISTVRSGPNEPFSRGRHSRQTPTFDHGASALRATVAGGRARPESHSRLLEES